MEVDHIFPRSLGGKDDPTNLVAACRRCNKSKSNSILENPPKPADVEKSKYSKGLVRNIYLPEMDKVVEMAISESVKRRKSIMRATMIREIVTEVCKIWKKKGRLPWRNV